MQGDSRVAALAARARALPITLTLGEGDAFLRLLRTRLGPRVG
jgi:predicted alpha/beta superfamily hydrolase